MARQVRMTLEQALARKQEIDWANVHATTEDDVRAQMVEDGQDPDESVDWGKAWLVIDAASVRTKLRMSQVEFADLIHVPVAIVQDWEQGRSKPDAAAQALLVILWREPEAARRALT